MQPKEKSIPLSVRFSVADVAEIAAVAPGGDLRAFVRAAVAEKMATLEKPISGEVEKRGGSHGGGRPVGSLDKEPRKRHTA